MINEPGIYIGIGMVLSLFLTETLGVTAGGIIVPMIESAKQLESIRDFCRWPPAGNRGVGYSRANLFGKYFDEYRKEAQCPLLVSQIENISAVNNLDEILKVDGLDAIMIGPYDLSASMGITGEFDNENFVLDPYRTIGFLSLYTK